MHAITLLYVQIKLVTDEPRAYAYANPTQNPVPASAAPSRAPWLEVQVVKLCENQSAPSQPVYFVYNHVVFERRRKHLLTTQPRATPFSYARPVRFHADRALRSSFCKHHNKNKEAKGNRGDAAWWKQNRALGIVRYKVKRGCRCRMWK